MCKCVCTHTQFCSDEWIFIKLNSAANNKPFKISAWFHILFKECDELLGSLTHSTLLKSSTPRHLHGLKIFGQALVAVCNYPYKCLYFIQSFIDGSQLHLWTVETHDFKIPCSWCWLMDIAKAFQNIECIRKGQSAIFLCMRHLNQRWLD
jgi:hypothetical protein